MELFLKIVTVFVIGGTIGWVMEFFYRRYAHGKWVNPGFLTGPCLPLYGSGLLLLYGLCHIDYSFIVSYPLRIIVQIVLQTVILTGIEYITGFVFVNFYHVRLWDYSKRVGNIQGIICPLFTVIWGAIGAIYSFVLHSHIKTFVSYVVGTPAMSFLLGIYSGILVVDLCYSFHIVTKIKKWSSEQNFIVRYENLKLEIRNRAEARKDKKPFLFFFRTKQGFLDELENYIATLREKQTDRKRRNEK